VRPIARGHGRWRLVDGLVTGTIALAVLAGAIDVPDLDAEAPKSPHETLTIGAATKAPAIHPGFLGLSLEYRTVEAYAGTDPAALDPVFLQLVRNINPNQRPVIRVGGDSTDWAWWPTASVRLRAERQGHAGHQPRGQQRQARRSRSRRVRGRDRHEPH
jgi:hypothetical protein